MNSFRADSPYRDRSCYARRAPTRNRPRDIFGPLKANETSYQLASATNQPPRFQSSAQEAPLSIAPVSSRSSSFVSPTLRTVVTVPNTRRAVLPSQRCPRPGSRAELHTPGSPGEPLRPDESADRRRAILHRAHCDCYIRDDPIPCVCTQLCAHFENRFSSAAAHIAAVRAELSRRHREKVPRSRQAKSVVFESYAREIGRVINTYSQPFARLFQPRIIRIPPTRHHLISFYPFKSA